MIAQSDSIQWATGIFEGEGCIQQDKRRIASWYLSMRMTDKDVVDRFAKVMGCGNVVELHPPAHRAKGWSKFYSWTISSRAAVRKVLARMLPYLGNRRAYKALNALDDIELQP